MTDSYDLLAKSIERVIRSDLPAPKSKQELSGAIDRIMLEEARAGELRLAYLRVLVVAPLVALSLWSLLGAGFAPALVIPSIASVAWLSIAIALAVALRRAWYARWVPHVMPSLSAALILAVFVPPLAFGDSPWRQRAPELVAYVAALCAFLSLSGALRLSRSSARTGTALALVVFVVVAASARTDPLVSLAIMGTLVATGLLSGSVTTLVRRVVTDEVAKATLTMMYDEAQAAIDKAQAEIRTREQVLKVVAHDLRGPLNRALGSAELMHSGITPEKAYVIHKRAADEMNQLIQDLLDVDKLNVGSAVLTPSEIDIAAFLREAHESLSLLTGKKKITLELQLADALPRITADRKRLVQVVGNLVGNSIKFTPEEGVITIACKPIPAGVQLSVIDTGCGIARDHLERVFGGFWQADVKDRRGIGLGLAIVKGIVDAHGGRIWVESELGKGTAFHVALGTAPPPPGTSGSRRQRATDRRAEGLGASDPGPGPSGSGHGSPS